MNPGELVWERGMFLYSNILLFACRLLCLLLLQQLLIPLLLLLQLLHTTLLQQHLLLEVMSITGEEALDETVKESAEGSCGVGELRESVIELKERREIMESDQLGGSRKEEGVGTS